MKLKKFKSADTADIFERGTLQRTPITRPATSNRDINEVNSFHMAIGLR